MTTTKPKVVPKAKTKKVITEFDIEMQIMKISKDRDVKWLREKALEVIRGGVLPAHPEERENAIEALNA